MCLIFGARKRRVCTDKGDIFQRQCEVYQPLQIAQKSSECSCGRTHMYYLVLVHAFSCLLWTWWYACSIHAICTWTLRPSLSLHRLNSLIFSYHVPWRQCPEVRFCVFFLHTPLFSISVPLGLGNWTFRMYYIYIQIYIYNHIHNYHLSLSGEGLSNMSRVILPESLEDYMISYWGALQLPIAKDACYFLTNLYLCCLHQPVWISYVYCVHILCIYIIIHAKSGKPKNEAIPIQSYSWVYRYTPCLWWYKSSPILWLVTGTVYGIGFTVF